MCWAEQCCTTQLPAWEAISILDGFQRNTFLLEANPGVCSCLERFPCGLESKTTHPDNSDTEGVGLLWGRPKNQIGPKSLGPPSCHFKWKSNWLDFSGVFIRMPPTLALPRGQDKCVLSEGCWGNESQVTWQPERCHKPAQNARNSACLMPSPLACSFRIHLVLRGLVRAEDFRSLHVYLIYLMLF